VIHSLQERMDRIAEGASRATTRPRVSCIKWVDPTIAGGRWVPEMVRLAGGTDGLGHDGAPPTVIPWELAVQYGLVVLVAMG